MTAGKRARKCLASQWGSAVFAELLYRLGYVLLLAVEFCLVPLPYLLSGKALTALQSGGVTVLVLLLDVIVLSPLKIGRTAYYSKVSAGQRAPFRLIFSFYGKGYWAAVGWRLCYWTISLYRLTMWLLPASLCLACMTVLSRQLDSSDSAQMLWLLCTLFSNFLLLAGLVLWRLSMLKFQASEVLIACRYGVLESFRLSKRLMHGHIGEMVWLYCSFAGWGFLSLLVAPAFFAVPMFRTAQLAAWRHWLVEYKKRMAKRQRTCRVVLPGTQPLS